MDTFKEHFQSDAELLTEGAVFKKPSVLFALLWRTYSKVNGATDEKERAKYQAQLSWISGQMTFSYIKAIEDKLEGIEKQLKPNR